MEVEAISSISIATSALNAMIISDSLKRRLMSYGVDPSKIANEQEAQAVLAQKETSKTEGTNAVSYNNKELINETKKLASDLGLYIYDGEDMEYLLRAISVKIEQIKALFDKNENLKKVAEQFDGRYQNIYTEYMSRKEELRTQSVSSYALEAVASSSSAK